MEKINNVNLPINMYEPTRDYNIHKMEYQNAIDKVLNHGIFINGPEVRELETVLANYVNVKHCICVGNGTDALQIALMALNIGLNDEVITVSYTWISTAEIISVIGAKPIFVDIENDTFCIDSNKIEEKITSKTKAIIVVSLYGQIADMDRINEIGNKYNLPIIEDGAQSFGAKYKNKTSCSLSLIGTTSFFPSKPLGCFGDGGACFTNDENLAIKMRSIKNHGCLQRFHHNYIGINSRLDTLQAAILLVKMNYIDMKLFKRRQVANYYSNKLKSLEEKNIIKLPKTKKYNEHVWAQYSILLLGNKKNIQDKIYKKLREEKINVSIYYPTPLHNQKCFKDILLEDSNKEIDDLEITNMVSKSIINLPCYAEIKKKELDYICEQFINILTNIN